MAEAPSFVPGPRQRIIEFFRSVKNDRGALLLIPAVGVYVLVWSYLSVLKFYSLHATVFDLGLEMEQLWKFVHPVGFTALTYVLTALDQPFQFLVSPLSLPVSYPLLLVFQSIGLGSGAFAVYGIARTTLKGQIGPYGLALAYLLYFPLGGVNWFDFHAQAFFIPLFLWGFFCYITHRYRLAFVLFMVGAGTTYSYVLLVVLFAGLTITEMALRNVLFKEKLPTSDWKFSVVLLAVSVAFFLYQFLFYSYVIGISFIENADIVTGPIVIWNRVDVLVLLFVPMLFLPALAPKWLVMLAPFGFLELTSTAEPFNFPAIFRIQYTALAIPFVFIGTIYGIRTMDRLLARRARSAEDRRLPPAVHRFLRSPHRTGGLALTVLALVIGFAMVFQPYGPFNATGPDSFGTSAATEVNWTYFDQYTHLVSLIPPDTPYVLFQNSMPSVLPRPLKYFGAPLVTGLEHWVNVTSSDAARNQFPLELVQGQLANVPIDFAISDPNNRWYDSGDKVSMYAFFTTLYQSGFYGLLGEASGMTVLERSYSGPLEYYEPFTGSLSSTDLYLGNSSTESTGPFLSLSNLSNQPAWHSSRFPVSPGTYRVEFSLSTSRIDPSNRLALVVLANTTGPVLNRQLVTGENFTQSGTWTVVNFTVRLTSAYDDLEFAAWNASWNGTISIRSISVTEVAPPSSTFAGNQVSDAIASSSLPD